MQHIETLPVGTILDSGVRKYTINSILGHGGFGITYLATSQLIVGNIPVEVKFAIKEHYISSMNERQGTSVSISNVNNTEEIKESIDSFLVEAQRLNKLSLNHPGIVRVNESFRANGTAYYVMEYIKGQSLREFVKQSPQGRLSEDEALKLFRPIAETIGYLHENKITHFDIKPDNILIRENGEPVVIDFGLSKHYSSKGTPTSTIKAAGCSAGYSPMEQYVGITTFTPEADIYALGATLLYMLTGKDPMVSTEINEDIIRRSIPQDVSLQTTNAIVHAMEKLKENRTHIVEYFSKQIQHETIIVRESIGTDEYEDINRTKKIKTRERNKTNDSLGRKELSTSSYKKYLIIVTTAVLILCFMVWFLNRKEQIVGIEQESFEEITEKKWSPGFLTNYDELTIGDYFYIDGTISHELDKSKECAGIVFSLTTTDFEKKNGFVHGQIVALHNASAYVVWGPNIDLTSPFYNYKYDTEWMNGRCAREDRNGYLYTIEVLKRKDADQFQAFNNAISYPVPLPTTTSGWYLPSIGQLGDIVENLGGLKLGWTYGVPNGSDGQEAFPILKDKLNFNINHYGSSTECNDKYNWEYVLDVDKSSRFTVSSKDLNHIFPKGSVRSVAAF